jgi:hypothetical protein
MTGTNVRTALPLALACLATSLPGCSVRGEPERASLGDQPVADAGNEVVGRPLAGDEQREAYLVVLQELPSRLSQSNPALRPVVCLDRGIRTGPGGAYVEDHQQKWLDQVEDDGLVAAVGDHSTAACPDQSYWITLQATHLLSGDSVAVPLTAQPVVRRTGAQVDARELTAILSGRGSRWVVAEWR